WAQEHRISSSWQSRFLRRWLAPTIISWPCSTSIGHCPDRRRSRSSSSASWQPYSSRGFC
ncbi:MAG: hypothetical protein AVDCRST_MAG58-2833, partial [uncultured Rubrobacteraceae bacterium]